jgi:hypothetical protein
MYLNSLIDSLVTNFIRIPFIGRLIGERRKTEELPLKLDTRFKK